MERYYTQAAFIGEKEQEQLGKKTVAIIGVGALGSVCAELLARAGIGKLILFDDDKVTMSNLQRQSLYIEDDIDVLKVDAAKERLNEINSDVKVAVFSHKFEKQKIKADLILDCTDNMESRFDISEYCRKDKMKWVHAAASGSKGVVMVVTDKNKFEKIYFGKKEGFKVCDEGILNTTTFMTASIQVTEAVKVLLGKDYCKGMIRFDLWKNEFEVIKIKDF